MNNRRSHTAAIGPTGTAGGAPAAPTPTSVGPRPLQVVPTDPEGGPLNGGAQQVLDRLTSHIRLARGLGLEPLTIDERAAAMLDIACHGWRFDRRCRDGGVVLEVPHPLCVRAQYHHDVLLLEHGLLNNERASHER